MGTPVILWDIDGTLLRTPRVAVQCFIQAVEAVAGRPIVQQRYDLGGKTDPLIALELLTALGLADQALVDRVLGEVERRYEDLVDELRAGTEVLPGVHAVLAACGAASVLQTVVTGNIEAAARHKLRAGGIDHHLRLDCGAYGSDHVDRSELVRLALQRLLRHGPLERDDVWIVGDTPRDAACAAANEVRCLLVATGTYTVADLAGLGAAAVVPDLADVPAVLDRLGVATVPRG